MSRARAVVVLQPRMLFTCDSASSCAVDVRATGGSCGEQGTTLQASICVCLAKPCPAMLGMAARRKPCILQLQLRSSRTCTRRRLCLSRMVYRRRLWSDRASDTSRSSNPSSSPPL